MPLKFLFISTEYVINLRNINKHAGITLAMSK